MEKSKKKDKEIVEMAAERLAEIFIMQIEAKGKKKITGCGNKDKERGV